MLFIMAAPHFFIKPSFHFCLPNSSKYPLLPLILNSQRRFLSLHEYQAMSLFQEYNIDHPKGSLCTNAGTSKSFFSKYATEKGNIKI